MLVKGAPMYNSSVYPVHALQLMERVWGIVFDVLKMFSMVE